MSEFLPVEVRKSEIQKESDRLSYTREQIDLLKKTVATGLDDNEFKLLVEVAQGTGLNLFQRQIYGIKRGGKMTIQTGIDGYRLVAARTGRHAGTSDADFDSQDGNFPKWARVTVKKVMPNGFVADFTATARWSEYVQEQSPMWRKMPFLMLSKCAEALALRKAFPAELSGVYTAEEMMQADEVKTIPVVVDQGSGRVINPKFTTDAPAVLDDAIIRDQAPAQIQQPEEPAKGMASSKQIGMIGGLWKSVFGDVSDSQIQASVVAHMKAITGKTARQHLTSSDASKLIKVLLQMKEDAANGVEDAEYTEA
jgi:phage recombination protein Bet